MQTVTADTSEISYLNHAAPVLVAGSSDAAIERGCRIVENAGHRIGARLPVEQALERLTRQAHAGALWIELDCDGGRPMRKLLEQVSRDVSAGRYAAIVSTRSNLADAVSADISDGGVRLIVDERDSQASAALAVALAMHKMPLRFADRGSDKGSDRLRHLSYEVNRIASTLARLSTEPASDSLPVRRQDSSEAPDVSIELVRNVIAARRLRSRFFPDELFADPAWDMMLDLFQAELAQLRVPVSSLCIASAVPATTALRWLKTMVRQGLFVRRSDPYDGRRIFVELAPHVSETLRRYFGEIGSVPVI
jgi:hypothetical protein